MELEGEEGAEGHPVDTLIAHFYRWISSSHSKLYDYSLHRLVHGLMKKVFFQLIAEFKKLGSKILFANFNRIIIVTNKTTVRDATTYCDFILNNLRQKELFSWLDIEPKRYWENLFFMDHANYGGIEHSLHHQEDESDSSSQSSSSSLSMPLVSSNKATKEKIISHWNIAEFLPKAVQQHVLLMVTDFIVQLRSSKKSNHSKLLSSSDSSITFSDKENSNPNTLSGSRDQFISEYEEEEDEEEASSKDAKRLINTYLVQRLFKIVEDIQRSLSGDHSSKDKASSEFPELPGSHLALNNPALEFIKTICKILSLDKHLVTEVYRLRKSLLKLIGVGEFSTDAEFVNPCLSYVMNDVMCTYCNSICDLDLLRDPALASSKWACRTCGHGYNKEEIEANLVETLMKKSLNYQLQDLVCKKCNEVKADNMSDICTTCSGLFVCKIPPEEFKKR
jgi:DNA polymerase epsilon subunit 1